MDGRQGGTELDHEPLDVYHLALDFLVLASEIIEISAGKHSQRTRVATLGPIGAGAGRNVSKLLPELSRLAIGRSQNPAAEAEQWT